MKHFSVCFKGSVSSMGISLILIIQLVALNVSDSASVEGDSVTKVSISPSNLTGPPGWININETFSVNVTVSDVTDLFYWQAGLTFNPTVLQCVNFTEGPFLRVGGETVWQSGTIDNENGVITPYGASLTMGDGVSGDGTLSSITFKVRDTGVSRLHLEGVILLDSNYEKIKPVVLIDGNFELPSPGPKPPNAYFFYYPLTPYVNETVTFNASESTPNGGIIKKYEWDFDDGSQDLGMIINHTYISSGDYNVTLTVTDSKNLTDTFSQLITILPLPLGASVDVYTQRDGKGLNKSSDAFTFQELVIFTAYLISNGSPLADTIVSFNIYDPEGINIRSKTATTDDDGLAMMSFRIVAEAPFGTYTTVASASVEGNQVSDTLCFNVGWLIEIIEVIPCDLSGNPTTSFIKGTMMCFNVTVKNICSVSRSVTMPMPIFDALEYRIGYFALYEWQIPHGQTEFLIGLMIPESAFSGNATVYVNAYTNWPSHGGVPYCPEKLTTFLIKRLIV